MAGRRVAEYEPLTEQGMTVMRDLHPQLLHYRIGFVLVDPPYRSNGRELAGRARLATPVEQGLLERDAWVEIAQAHWLGEPEEWQIYLLDHELSHFRAAGNAPAMVGHDFEDFSDVLRRHFSDESPNVLLSRIAQEAAETVR